MNWTTVEAVCDCPHKLEGWHAFIDSSVDDSLLVSKGQIREAIQEHLSESEHCTEENVTMKVHYEETVPTLID